MEIEGLSEREKIRLKRVQHIWLCRDGHRSGLGR